MVQSFAELSKHEDGYQVRFERVYPHAIEHVWDAITDPAKISVWFHETESERQVGGRLTIRFNDEAKTETYGRIVAYDPPRLYEFMWENEDVPDELTRWELHEEGPNQCRLVFTHSRLAETYGVSVSAGWHFTLDDLGQFLDGAQIARSAGTDGSEEERDLVEKYREIWQVKFGA